MEYNKRISEIEVRLRLAKHRHRLIEEEDRGEEAYTSILSREPPEDYLRDWQSKLNESIESRDQERQISMLVFRIGLEIFGCDIIYIKDIAPPKAVHKIPLYSNRFVNGCVNFKGRIQTVFSLENLLTGIQDKKWSPAFDITSRSACRMVLVQSRHREMVFLVDEILGIFEYEERQKKDLPMHVERDPDHILSGVISWGDHQDVGMLDVERLAHRIGS